MTDTPGSPAATVVSRRVSRQHCVMTVSRAPAAAADEPAAPIVPALEPRRPRRRRLPLPAAAVAAVLVVALAGVFGTALVRPLAEPATPPPPQPGTFRPTKAQLAGLDIAPVRVMAFRSEDTAEGNIAIDDDRTTPVFSPFSGRVTRLVAKLGDVVARGAPLFAIEASEFVQAQNDLITALAALRTARAQAAQAQTNEKRGHELYLANGGALKDWQQNQTDLAAARNTVHAGEIALAAVRNRLLILGKSDSDIAALERAPTQRIDPVAIVPAPIAGTVTQRQVGLGQYINSAANGAANPVYTIGDLSTVWLVANVREADAPAMRVGEPAEVRVLALPGRVFQARLSWVAPALDAATHRLPVRADVDNPDGTLKPMMLAEFSITTGSASEAPAVPDGAVVYEGDAAHVWALGGDGTIASRAVRTGRRHDGMVEILAGLAPGDKVVTSGTLFIDRAASAD